MRCLFTTEPGISFPREIGVAVFLFQSLAALFARYSPKAIFAPSEALPGEFSGHEYARRLQERQQQLAALSAKHRRLWAGFIGLLSAATGMGALTLWRQFPLAWTLPVLAALVMIVRLLTETARAHSRTERTVSFYRSGLARLAHDWQSRGDTGEEFQPRHHLYARDLDLFGEGSLFEYLCTARTGVGRETLAEWLLNPAGAPEIAERQRAVTELRDKLALQEVWTAAGSPGLRQVESHVVREWAKAPEIVIPSYLRLAALGLPAILLTLAAFGLSGFLPGYWLYAVAIVLALEAGVSLRWRKKTRQIAADAGLPSFELETIAPLLDIFSTQKFECSLLVELQNSLTDPPGKAGKQIRRLSLWTRLLELRQSEYFAAAFSLLLWGTNFAIAVERWRQQHRAALCEWLRSIGCFEALLCLARYHFENPEYIFPILRPESPGYFRGDSLGHPLLGKRSCVPCDVLLDADACPLMLVTGSNMSGKSTLLRSVGINAVLAFAGAPVRASPSGTLSYGDRLLHLGR